MNEEFASVNTAEVAEPQTINPDYTEALQDPGTNWEEAHDDEQALESGNNEEVAEPQRQDAETNAQYAKMRRDYEAKVAAAEMKAKDEMIARIYGDSHGIKTFAEYEKAVREAELEQEAEEAGMDPKTYAKLKELEAKVQTYEKQESYKEQDQKLSKDPVTSSIYKQYRDEIKDISNQYSVDLQSAFTFLVGQKLPEILGNAQQSTINKISENGRSSPGSLSKAGANQNYDAFSMSNKDFEAMVERAKRGDLRKS